MNTIPNADKYLVDHIERNQYFQRSINIHAVATIKDLLVISTVLRPMNKS